MATKGQKGNKRPPIKEITQKGKREGSPKGQVVRWTENRGGKGEGDQTEETAGRRDKSRGSEGRPDKAAQRRKSREQQRTGDREGSGGRQEGKGRAPGLRGEAGSARCLAVEKAWPHADLLFLG